MNAKGQEGAPFEVLVSVVIMSFVIVVALNAINTVGDEQCKAQIKKEASTLKAKIQDVVKGNDSALHFFPPKCFEQENEVMKLQVIHSEQLCSYYCGGTKRECLVFLYDSPKFSEILCLESASVNTTFYMDPGVCPDRDGFVPKIFLDGIPRGTYNLVNKSGSDSAFPKICAYLQQSTTR